MIRISCKLSRENKKRRKNKKRTLRGLKEAKEEKKKAALPEFAASPLEGATKRPFFNRNLPSVGHVIKTSEQQARRE